MMDTESAVDQQQTATFAGGCFWCMQPPFDQLDGVLSTIAGYAGGHVQNPGYEQVCAGTTGHTEVIQIAFDPGRVSYTQLLEVFWRNIDPTAVNRQFVDIGNQYRSAIFYNSEEQRQQAETSRSALAASGRFNQPITTEITALDTFYPAEDYHQDYYQKNPQRYKSYHDHSGRDQYLDRVWKDEP
jgi:methionine-S-sulfoxide reductase